MFYTSQEGTKDKISLEFCCGQHGLVGWALSYKAEGHWFGSGSGNMPGLWARSPAGDMGEATD